MKKTAFIIGGSGLIGSQVIKSLLKKKIKNINLDLKKRENSRNSEIFQKFDFKKKGYEKNLLKIIKKYGSPDIFINCSYPKTNDWEKNTFKKITNKSIETNIKINLITSCLSARLIAEECIKEKKKCVLFFIFNLWFGWSRFINI